MSGLNRWILIVSGFGIPAFTSTVLSQGVSAVSVDVENDYFIFWRPPNQRSDDNYTHGIHVDLIVGAAPIWMAGGLSRCVRDATLGSMSLHADCVRSRISAGHELYTPTRDSPTPVAGERPYAALLYLGFAMERVRASSLSALSLRVGTTGHAALGDLAQAWFHSQVPSFRTPLGWDHQIASQPVFIVGYNYRKLLTEARRTSNIAIAPTIGLAAGNLAVVGRVGLDARAGYRAPHPWQHDAIGTSGLRAYLIFGASEDLVGYSLLLEGNTPSTRNKVSRRTAVPQLYSGFALGLSNYTVEFHAVSRGQDYTTGPQQHQWAKISLNYTAY